MTGRASESGRITFHSAANLSTGTDTHVRVRVSVRLLQAARIFSSTRQGLCGRHNKIYKLRPGENKSEQDSSRVLMVVSGADARSLSVELVDYASTSDSTVCARSVGAADYVRAQVSTRSVQNSVGAAPYASTSIGPASAGCV